MYQPLHLPHMPTLSRPGNYVPTQQGPYEKQPSPVGLETAACTAQGPPEELSGPCSDLEGHPVSNI